MGWDVSAGGCLRRSPHVSRHVRRHHGHSHLQHDHVGPHRHRYRDPRRLIRDDMGRFLLRYDFVSNAILGWYLEDIAPIL